MRLQVTQHRFDWVTLPRDDFSHVDTELTHSRSRTVLRQKLPTLESFTNTRKVGPLRCTVGRNVQQRELRSRQQGGLECVMESYLAAFREIRWVENALNYRSHLTVYLGD